MQNANVNLKRTCGVSYVKPTESEQKNISHIWKPLPPLIYQCSSGCQRMEQYQGFYNKVFENLFKSKNRYLFCTYFHSDDEMYMREYILHPEKRFELANGRFFYLGD